MPRKRLSDFRIVKSRIIAHAKAIAGDRYTLSLEVVLKRICQIPEYSCSINIKEGEGVNDYIEKWTNKFINGYDNRASQRTSNPIGTKHDAILDGIINARLPNLTDIEKKSIKYGHRLSMSAENIAGSLLEEYLAQALLGYKWHCCWGETMKSIDFCNENGEILQVKNSDNSENSSSKTVRDGTKIQHWFRRFSRTGETNWGALNELAGITDEDKKLSEEKYRAYVESVVTQNPNVIFVEEGNPWEDA